MKNNTSPKQEIKNLKFEIKELKEFLERYYYAYSDLKDKYDGSLGCLKTLACKSVYTDSPAGWEHEQRMAWTAAKKLGDLANVTTRKPPERWEFA